MTRNQIVIVTNKADSHTDEVVLMLNEMGHEPVRLNTNDIPLQTMMSLGWETNSSTIQGSITIQTNGRIINVDDIRSIWWRRPCGFNLPISLTEQEHEFAQDEIEHALWSLWSSLGCYWISHPEHIRQGSWKGNQLQRAVQLGFEVPRTLITTDPEEAKAFYNGCHQQVVFKVVSDPFLGAPKIVEKHPDQPPPAPYMAHTTILQDSDLGALDTISLVPCMFQEYIPKQVELRVTVVGDDIFAAEIHSQANEKTRVDWRHYDVDIPYRKATLPEEVASRCLALVKSYNLNFSAIDLILTPDGRYVFVESNPNGQFIFVEERVPELRMTEALVACLIRGSNS